MPPHLGAGLNTVITLPLLVHCVLSLLTTGCHLFQTSICPFLTAFGVASSILFQIQELHKPLYHVKVKVPVPLPLLQTRKFNIFLYILNSWIISRQSLMTRSVWMCLSTVYTRHTPAFIMDGEFSHLFNDRHLLKREFAALRESVEKWQLGFRAKYYDNYSRWARQPRP